MTRTYTPAAVAKQLAKVRAFCLALPDVTERMSHGAPTFFAKGGKRSFATFVDDHHDDGRLAVVVCAAPGAQAMLVEANSDVYYLPPYVAHMGWIGVRLDRKAPWSEVAHVLEQAYLARIAKR